MKREADEVARRNVSVRPGPSERLWPPSDFLTLPVRDLAVAALQHPFSHEANPPGRPLTSEQSQDEFSERNATRSRGEVEDETRRTENRRPTSAAPLAGRQSESWWTGLTW